MKRIFSAGRGLSFIVFMTVFLFTGCGQSAEPKSEVKNPTLHDAAVKMVADMSLEETRTFLPRSQKVISFREHLFKDMTT